LEEEPTRGRTCFENSVSRENGMGIKTSFFRSGSPSAWLYTKKQADPWYGLRDGTWKMTSRAGGCLLNSWGLKTSGFESSFFRQPFFTHSPKGRQTTSKRC